MPLVLRVLGWLFIGLVFVLILSEVFDVFFNR